MSARSGRTILLTFLSLLLVAPAFAAPPRVDADGDPLPAGALVRMGTTRLRPGGGGGIFAISPDGKLLATGEQFAVRLWDLATGKEVRAVELQRATMVRSIRFSPDGKRLAVIVDTLGLISRPWSDEDLVYVAEVGTGKVLCQIGNREEAFPFAEFLRDGKTVVTRRRAANQHLGEGEVVLWDLATGAPRHRLPDAFSCACAASGNVLATGHSDGSLRVFDTITGKEQRHFNGHGAPVFSLALSPDGKWLASAGGDERDIPGPPRETPLRKDTSVRLWRTATGEEVFRLTGHLTSVHAVQFSPDGRTLLSVDAAGNLLLWDVATGGQRLCLTDGGYRACHFAISPDSTLLAWNRHETELHLVRLDTGKEVRRWRAPARWLGEIAFTPDGKSLVTRGAALCVWEVATGKQRHVREGHLFAVEALTFSPDGRFLASLDGYRILRLWDAKTGRPLPPFTGAGPHRVQRYGFLSGGKVLAALGTDATLRAWDTTTGKVLHETRVAGEETARRWQADGYWYAQAHRPPWHAEQCPVFGPDNATLAVVGDDTRLHLWDVATGRRLARLDAGHPPHALVAFALDGRALVSESPDRALRLWDLPAGKPLAKIDAAEKSEPFIAFSADSRLLAWGCGETIHVWDRTRGKEIARLKGHEGRTERVGFDRDSRTLVSGGIDRTLRLWDAWTGQELRQLRDNRGGSGDTSFRVGPDGRLLPLISTCPKNSRYSLREACSGREVCELHSGWGGGFALSPDGRVLVTSREFVETATGSEIALAPEGHRGGIRALAFSPDGRLLATGGTDTSILLWDWQRLSHPERGDGKQKEPAALWKDLAAAEPSAAYRAIGVLVADPSKAVALLKEHLRPVGAEDRERVRRLLKDLESRRFAERERAVQELAKVTAEWEPLLREAMGGRPALEVRRRLEPLLDSASLRHWSPETVRGLRALQVLEQIGDAEARRLLQRIADGLPEARLTQEAEAALRRLDRRAARP